MWEVYYSDRDELGDVDREAAIAWLVDYGYQRESTAALPDRRLAERYLRERNPGAFDRP